MAVRLKADHKTIVLAACDCAELSQKYVQEDEKRPGMAIQTARAWAADKVTIGEVRATAHAARAAAHVAADAVDAAYAAYAAYAVAYAARLTVLQQCAGVVRKYITWDTVAKAANERETIT